MKPALQIVHSLARLQCTKCGAEANASCNCGEPYVPAALRVAEYDKANPGKSTREAAADLGISNKTVSKARGVTGVTPETVTGRDGKEYPARRAGQEPLETNNNFEPDGDSEAEDQEDAVADPATIEDNVLYYLQRMNEHARVRRRCLTWLGAMKRTLSLAMPGCCPYLLSIPHVEQRGGARGDNPQTDDGRRQCSGATDHPGAGARDDRAR